MDVKFVPNTHYVFSVGKDRLLKYWDADKFELLLTVDGHHAEIWCLALSSRGDFIVTGSHDRSIRRWDRTDEPFFIEVSFSNSLLCYVVSLLENYSVNFNSIVCVINTICRKREKKDWRKCLRLTSMVHLIIDMPQRMSFRKRVLWHQQEEKLKKP